MNQTATGNVLLVQTDQWNARLLGILGHPNARTPNLDRLAREGTVFANAYCNNPLSLPSRVSMLTGTYISTNKQFGFSGYCDRRLPWLQKLFKQAGYATGASGKFHVDTLAQDEWMFDWAAPTLPELDLSRPAGNNYMEYCRANGVPWPTDQMHCGNPFGPSQMRSSRARDDMFWMEARSVESDVPASHSLEAYTVDRCLEYLRSHRPSDRPFFYWLTFDRPHFPTTLPPEWFAKVRPESVQFDALPTAEQLASMPPSMFQDYARHVSRFNAGEQTFRFIIATYCTLLEYIDHEIGRVLDYLREADLDKTTTILFTADHGDEAGVRGIYEKFVGVSSEEICRAPLIVRPAPALSSAHSPGRILGEPVELVDVLPTLCSLAGLAIPPEAEGRDLSRAVLHGEPLDARRAVFNEEWHSRTVVRDGWKLVYDVLADERQLYDLSADPWCFRNRYADAATLHQRIELKRLLLGFLVQRVHGPYTEQDVEEWRERLDPATSFFGHTTSRFERLTPLRAGASIKSGSWEILVPFFDGEDILLFHHTKAGAERRRRASVVTADPFARQEAGRVIRRGKRDEAADHDPGQVDRLLDQGLDEMFAEIHRISCTRDWPKCEYARPSLEAARRLHQRWEASKR